MPAPPTRAEALAEFLRQETTGGRLLLVATAIALAWANLLPGVYEGVWEAELGGLTLADWATDGLLAIFFFVAGMELRREFTDGELASRRAAALPVVAAIGGMVVPALVALAVSAGAAADGGAWAIPVATDIAFALGVLALAGAALPSGVRVLLLSIAVVDDLVAITLIAVLFSAGIDGAWLAGAALACGLWVLAFRVGADRALVLAAIAIATWAAVHESGVHATVAGVALGLLTPGRARARLEHVLHPVSAGIAVPVFALAAAGIPLGAALDAPGDAVAVGVFAGLLAGKVIGIFGAARLAVAAGLATLPARVGWRDVFPVAVLGSIGYTVSLLIARLSLDEVAAQERAAASILAASVIAAITAVILLRRVKRGGSGRQTT